METRMKKKRWGSIFIEINYLFVIYWYYWYF